MKTYIVIATEDERKLINEFKEFIPNKVKDIIVTGVGGLNVIETLQHIRKNSRIINIGYVGSNHYNVGANLVVSKAALYHPNVKYNSPLYLLNDVFEGNVICFTSSDFVKSTPLKTPVIFDMELAFICSLGFKEVVSLKQVSDKLNYKQYEKSIAKKE